MADRNEGNAKRRLTVSIEEFRANPGEASRQALTREVAIVVDSETRIVMSRRLEPLT